jgi:hypothetical protein
MPIKGTTVELMGDDHFARELRLEEAAPLGNKWHLAIDY